MFQNNIVQSQLPVHGLSGFADYPFIRAQSQKGGKLRNLVGSAQVKSSHNNQNSFI